MCEILRIKLTGEKPMAKKHIVRLTATERGELEQRVNTGKAAAYKRRHAQILLKSDYQ